MSMPALGMDATILSKSLSKTMNVDMTVSSVTSTKTMVKSLNASSQKDLLQVFVRISWKIFSLNVAINETVASMKERLYDLCRINPCTYRLLSESGKHFDIDAPLSQQGIADGSFLRVVCLGRGGMQQTSPWGVPLQTPLQNLHQSPQARSERVVQGGATPAPASERLEAAMSDLQTVQNAFMNERETNAELTRQIQKLSKRLDAMDVERNLPEMHAEFPLTPGVDITPTQKPAKFQPKVVRLSLMERREFGLGEDRPTMALRNPETTASYLGNSVPEVPIFKATTDNRVEMRMFCLQSWLLELRFWVNATCNRGEFLWNLLDKALQDYHENWLAKSGDANAQAVFSMKYIWDGGEAVKGFEEYCTRSYARVFHALPQDMKTIHWSDMQLHSLSPFQRFAALLITVTCNYGLRSLDDVVSLVRKLESPASWVVQAAGDRYHGELGRWWQLVQFANGLGLLDWSRIQLGLRSLVSHVNSLLNSFESHQLNISIAKSRVHDFHCDPDMISELMKVVLHLCRTSTQLLQKPAAQATRNLVAAVATRRVSNITADSPCWQCKKPLREHENRRFCENTCHVCSKKQSEHADFVFCKKNPN